MNIETGDNLLVSSEGFLPEAIQWFENCKWNHSAFFLWINNVLYVIESDGHGIALTKFQDYINGYKGLLVLKPKLPIDDKIKSEIIDYVLEYTGHTPYDFLNLLFFQPIRYITKFLFSKEIWIGRSKRKANKRFICGEWVAYIYNHFFGWFINWNQVAPVDIYINKEYFDHYEYIRELKKIRKCQDLLFTNNVL